MSIWFLILTIAFIIVSAVMVLIILVQRPQGGGLAGAFGGAGGGTDTVFGGRVGDALTVMTVIAFVAYLGIAIGLNIMDPKPGQPTAAVPSVTTTSPTGQTTTLPVEPVDAPPFMPAPEEMPATPAAPPAEAGDATAEPQPAPADEVSEAQSSSPEGEPERP